jgi:antirestriction protein ArdC
MDLKAQVTNAIISLIEQGQAKGAGALWDKALSHGMPVNYKTKRPYSGVNVPLLWSAAAERGLSSNEWLTFKQAQELGANVKKGAKGVMGVFFKMVPKKEAKGAEGEDAAMVPMLKPFWVFNVADIEGLPVVDLPTREEFEPMEVAERVLNASGARITWSGARAFYRPATDEIYMPDRDRFAEPVNAYAVALHELTHWTGHESRLNRDFSGRFGTEAYAFEELVAELGSAFVVAHLGLEGARLENHASYVGSWLKVLKNDTNAIFTASRHATAAYQHIMSLAGLAPAEEQA